ncbi:hypothetical protein BdWA1_002023 [Babesia duncani]|uniref:Uncharacterized protein n=1 Tax=Babesia duncani TaxID=323732 RepID=A0AAD9PL90_9APIC|nr:hypothetical protein BdWA1_002023 [Babesia duncani]
MDIPPVLRASLAVCSDALNSCRLIRSIPIQNSAEKPAFPLLKDEINQIQPLSINSKSLEALVVANVEQTVDFILSCTEQNDPSLEGCIKSNLKSLNLNQKDSIKLNKHHVNVIVARIESLIDIFNPTQLSQLTWALLNSDKRFHGTTILLIHKYCESIPQVTQLNSESLLMTNTLVLSNILYAKLVKDPPLISYQENKKVISKNLNQLENKALKDDMDTLKTKLVQSCNDCLKYLHTSGGANNLMLQLLQTFSLKGSLGEQLIPGLLERVKIDEMDTSQLVDFVHSCGLSKYNYGIECDAMCLATFDMIATKSNFDTCNIPKLFHSFYLSGYFTHPIFFKLVKHVIDNEIEFTNSTDFYRVAFPLAISQVIIEDAVGKWLLLEFAKRADEYAKLKSPFLFILTRLSGSLLLSKRVKSTSDLHLDGIDFENDIYEKAEMYLRQADGIRTTYFPSDRAALLFLFEKALSFCSDCNNDEFIQLLQAHCTRAIRHSTRTKLVLLKECRKRVNEINCGGISQVMQSLLWLFGQNNPDVINVAEMYMHRILAELTLYNNKEITMETESIYSVSFLNDIGQLAFILWALDRCNLNSPQVAKEVGSLISNNYNMLTSADTSHIVDIMHYMAFSLKEHEALDVLAMALHAQLKQKAKMHAKDLVVILEAFVACPINLNYARHRELVQEIQKLASNARGDEKSKSTLDKIIATVTKSP